MFDSAGVQRAWNLRGGNRRTVLATTRSCPGGESGSRSNIIQDRCKRDTGFVQVEEAGVDLPPLVMGRERSGVEWRPRRSLVGRGQYDARRLRWRSSNPRRREGLQPITSATSGNPKRFCGHFGCCATQLPQTLGGWGSRLGSDRAGVGAHRCPSRGGKRRRPADGAHIRRQPARDGTGFEAVEWS